jgi:hypothetical protein
MKKQVQLETLDIHDPQRKKNSQSLSKCIGWIAKYVLKGVSEFKAIVSVNWLICNRGFSLFFLYYYCLQFCGQIICAE